MNAGQVAPRTIRDGRGMIWTVTEVPRVDMRSAMLAGSERGGGALLIFQDTFGMIFGLDAEPGALERISDEQLLRLLREATGHRTE